MELNPAILPVPNTTNLRVGRSNRSGTTKNPLGNQGVTCFEGTRFVRLIAHISGQWRESGEAVITKTAQSVLCGTALLLNPIGLGAQTPLSTSDWTRKDTLAETAYLALHTADWLQTLQIRDPNCPFHENNPILGRKPSRGKVNTYFLATGIAHVLIARALPPRQRHWFQGITIGMEAGCVGNNYSLGVRVKF